MPRGIVAPLGRAPVDPALATTGAPPAPVVAYPLPAVAQGAITLLLTIALASGVRLGGGTATGVSCLIILILGLPHGAFDIRALLSVGTTGGRRADALVRYSAAGAMMALLWWAAPVLALALFFLMAVAHFGEDWSETASPFLSHGAALGLLSAPALLNGPAIRALFETVSGEAASAQLGDVLLLVAPVAVASTLTAIALLWSNRHRELAIGGLVAVLGLLVLPPVIGFALFFCLHHSPRQFGKALGGDARRVLHRWAAPTAATTIAALLMAATLYWLAALPSPSAGLVRASFITLSILTVPHMLLARIIGASDPAQGSSRMG